MSIASIPRAPAGRADAGRVNLRSPLARQHDGPPPLLDAEQDAERPVAAGDVEAIALDQVENGDSPLLLDIGVAAEDRTLVEIDLDDPRVGHDALLAGAASLIHISSTGLLA